MRDSDESLGQTIPDIFPDDAVQLTMDEIRGLLYSVYSPYGRRFRFFLWHGDDVFQISLVEPALESMESFDSWMRPDGRLRLPIDPAEPIDAFKASVVWATRMDFALRAEA